MSRSRVSPSLSWTRSAAVLACLLDCCCCRCCLLAGVCLLHSQVKKAVNSRSQSLRVFGVKRRNTFHSKESCKGVRRLQRIFCASVCLGISVRRDVKELRTSKPRQSTSTLTFDDLAGDLSSSSSSITLHRTRTTNSSVCSITTYLLF